MDSEERLISKLSEIKRLNEEASLIGGESAINQIRASKLIMPIHEYIKEELIAQGVNPSKIFPPVGSSSPETKLIGFLKGKNQDITVLPVNPSEEKIEEGVLMGNIDKVGAEATSKALSINVRSQLSSIAKNFDTLYERTFAEALNLHLRSPDLVMGEVYLVPVIAYDPDNRGNGSINFRELLPAAKYVASFSEINNRGIKEEGEAYKYERVCLLIVDFRQDPPRVINDINELVELGVLDAEKADRLSLQGLTIKDFIKDILKIYEQRHGSLDVLK